MSERFEIPLSEQLGANWGIPGAWIEPHLAAAEERGRRRGLEERDKEVRDARRVIAMLVKRLGGEVLLGRAGLLAFNDRTVLETRHDSDGMRIKVLAPRDSGPRFSMPECPGPDCRSCNGEACDLCGAGKTGFHGRCDHDVIDRHRAPRDSGKDSK